MANLVSRFKKNTQNFKTNFKGKLKKARENPRSKRKSFLIGFTSVIAIFGITLFGPALSAVAKDIVPTVTPNPNSSAIAPAPVLPPSHENMHNLLTGFAGTLCSLAVTSGSLLMGVACGVVVAAGILHMQKKPLFPK